jgi:hypothetical protein
MTYPGQQYPPPPQGHYPPQGWAPPPAPKKTRKWPWIVGGVVGFIVLLSAIGGNSAPPPSSTTGATAIPTVAAVAPTIAAPAPAAEAEPAPAPAQSGPMTSFQDVETLAVGTDIEPGQYTTDGAPGGFLQSNCYYEIHKSDAGTFTDLVKYGNIGENSKGRVTLRKGQYFSSNGGCTWTKAG